MGSTELDPRLEAEALREIERSLFGKLRAHRLSEAFIERYGEDALQKGLVEYLRAIKDGATIENRDAFVVQAAFCRAIDELRREARRSDGATVEAIIDSGRFAVPPAEDLVVAQIETEELRKAIATLSTEERQVLNLYYFERRTVEGSAQILHCSERTFRRRMKKTLRTLGRRLGGPAPEPGSELAIEIGLAAWVSLRGARAVPTDGLLEQLVSIPDSIREGAASLIGRTRDFVTRFFSSDAGEKTVALASGPVGKAGGVCTGAVALCLLSGTVGPGVGIIDVISHHRQPPKSQVTVPQSAPSATPADPVEPQASIPAPSASPEIESEIFGARRHKTTAVVERHLENRDVQGQAYGLRRAEKDSAPAAPPVSIASGPESSEAPSAQPAPSSSARASTDAEQAKQEFGAFK